MKKTTALVTAALFLGCILAANYVTTRYGFVPVGFGLTATAGTYFAGLSFVLRDTLQDTAGRWWTLAVIAAGAGLSLLLALTLYRANGAFLPPSVTPTSIAVASGVAFLFGETLDLAVYTPLRAKGYIRAAVASNVVGAIVDTWLFLTISGFGVAGAWQGQLVGKLLVTVAVIAAVVAVRAGRKAASA